MDISKQEFKSKEQVIFFMMTTSISLSHYDHKFISNMQSLTHDKKQITSGQAELFDKLLVKYRKQWATNGYTDKELTKLPWKCVVVPSLPLYTNANVDWDDSIKKLTIRVPFKKDFIAAFRKEMLDIIPDSSFNNNQTWIWHTERKRYEANPSTHALKLAYETLPKFFTTVYHNEVKDIITSLESKTVKYGDPTLIYEQDTATYTVVNSNEILDVLLKDKSLDNSPQCLHLMSQLGIKVDTPITENNPELLFASSYIIEGDIDELDHWCGWLVNLGVEELLIGRGGPTAGRFVSSKKNLEHNIYNECKEAFIKYNLRMIRPGGTGEFFDKEVDTIPNSTPVLIQFNSIVEPDQCHGVNRNSKIIIITNRRTVEIS